MEKCKQGGNEGCRELYGKSSSIDKEVVFLYRGGREKRFSVALEGRCPTEFFYGAIELIKQGHNVRIADINYETSSSDLGLIDKIFDQFFKYQLLPSRVYGPLLKKIWMERQQFQSADVIVATTPGIAFAVSILKVLLRMPARIVAIQLGLVDYKFSRRRIFLNRFFLKRMKSIVYTELEQKMMLEKYGLQDDSTMVNQFGIDTSFWDTSTYDHKGYVLAVGSDGKRDYDVLLRAAEKVDKQLIIVTNREIEERASENVKIFKGDWLTNRITDADIRDLYSRASVVVTPLKQTTRPSGQSVCLQAMSCGRPVVLSAIHGLWAKELLHDDETVVLTAPGDIEELVSKIKSLTFNEARCKRIGDAARDAVLNHATTEHWASRIKSFF